MWTAIAVIAKKVPGWMWFIIAFSTAMLFLLHDRDVKLNAAIQAQHQTALALDSTLAVGDTTRKILAGQVDLWQHRVIQSAKLADSLQGSLHDALVTVAQLKLQLKAASVTTVAKVDTSPTTRSATFEAHEPPTHVRVHVSLPLPPDSGTAQFSLWYDPIHLGLRVSCDSVSQQGIHPAEVGVITDHGVAVLIDSTKQDDHVCSPPPSPVKRVGDITTKLGLFAIIASVFFALGHLGK